MNKVQRHLAIKELILEQVVENLQELLALLKERGFDVNQATLSRDMKDLGIVRTKTKEGRRYVLDKEHIATARRFQMILSYEIESIKANETLIVIKTLPGHAQGVARAIDNLNLDSIMGTIAGDDSVFIAPNKSHTIPSIVESIKNLAEIG